MQMTIDRDGLFEQHEWLDATDKPMILGTDLDALLSGAFMSHHFDWYPIGFYNLSELHIAEDHVGEIDDAIWLDLDIYDDRYPSIGHHIVSMRPDDTVSGFDNSINVNLERGVWGEGYRFTRKCPVGTIMFLSWLYETGEPERSHMFWLADSAWINGQSHKYRENVGEWVTETFGADWMVSDFEKVDTESFENTMGGLFVDMEMEIDPDIIDTGRSKSRHHNIGGYQFGFDDPRSFPVQRSMDMIAEQQNWHPAYVPDDYVTVVGDRSHRLQYDDILAGYRGIDEWLSETEPFSYAIPYGGTINYTTEIDPDVLQ